MESTQNTAEVRCPLCASPVHMHENVQVTIKDVPLFSEIRQYVSCFCHRYICTKCGHTYTEELPFIYPGTRITNRAAVWIKEFLKNKLSIMAIQNGIHWDTIRKVQKDFMEAALNEREQEKQNSGYKPRYLAIDEFAIHKGHSYATCVMDLETGDVLWVGKGRSMNDFAKFFEDISPDTLSEVIAVAMDMNASYNILVEKHLPQAQIVYDRYHMQAQFGKEVLGVVRLEEARKHKTAASEILAGFKDETDKDKRAELKEKRILGLAAHALFPISTGKLEGFNNKIKGAKRVGYGYRDEQFFFMLIRFMPLLTLKTQSHGIP